MHPEDDTPPQRPRWLAAALIVAVLVVVAGMLIVGWRTLQADNKGANASNCMRCQGRPDAVDYLAGKIRNGGSGEWGRTLMPRHPQLSEEQARQMAQWVMPLPPA